MVFKTYIILLSCPDIKYPVFSMGLRYSVKSIWAFASFYCILPWPVTVRKLSVAKGKKKLLPVSFFHSSQVSWDSSRLLSIPQLLSEWEILWPHPSMSMNLDNSWVLLTIINFEDAFIFLSILDAWGES